MEFARRGRAATSPVDEDVDDDHRVLYPPPYGDPMLVIRDALLSQLQQDRLRHEIILAEVAKIERAMVLYNARHGIATAGVEWTKPVPFTFNDEFVPHRQWFFSPEHYADVDSIHDHKKRDGSHGCPELKSGMPAMGDCVSECLRPCYCNSNAGQENAKIVEQKLQEVNETVQPKKILPSVKWKLTEVTIPVKKPPLKLSRGICQVQATSKHSLQEHCAGRKHGSSLATLESRNKAINQKAEMEAKKRGYAYNGGQGRYERGVSSGSGPSQHGAGSQGGRGSTPSFTLPATMASSSNAAVGGAAPTAEMVAQAVAVLSQALVKPAVPDVVPIATQSASNTETQTAGKGKEIVAEGLDSEQRTLLKSEPKETSGKQPYCYRCLKKGHVRQVCTAKVYCDICRCEAHDTDRCPQFRGEKPSALTCGYAMDGLGFYYIPVVPKPKQKMEALAAVVRVTGGSLSEAQIVSELERLVSHKWKWEVVKIGPNLFKTHFPSREELAHMMEWGVVQTKYNASMKIEEQGLAKSAKAELKKVWIQFTGIPSEMNQFLLIWAVGSILGVTKAVDMKFTNKYDVCRLQVLVLDPNLIPQFVDVVIGDHLYELQFKVEENVDEENPEPIAMEDGNFGDDTNMMEDTDQERERRDTAPQDKKKSGETSTGNGGGSVQKGKNKVASDVQEMEVLAAAEGAVFGADLSWAQVPGSPGNSASLGAMDRGAAGIQTPNTVALAAVPEATMGSSVSHRSKRRAATSAGDSIERATKLKAARNLDTMFSEGSIQGDALA